ncbi:hypothetical protein Kpol_1006p14 [Vanderwaltozyma polyspora DSM 70294]|uniref:non-specific serine/threonine protein kinase n=1 Tax=Vanderwaltozyma polyspora (strain ATCC 22028 / DSM 70294 / BCRC 21397 / CBS 2163 / NBRC 10782 / NRRL Y-8283 / UCD 57-17) TaxID=436907 RepID=A7TQ49_VANPO|nr:uncharacterized protein Kpol_1006p14 [Vanderwaltozyma polyspora DSM 70294]EDO15617.1 hypothetical protein Kpol_1006p14 [Vanderwaltozyma polyspora DSM 70294]
MAQRSSHQQHIVGIHYAVGPKIGEGSFGVIFEGENILNKDNDNNGQQQLNQPVAIKFEPRRSDAPQLRDEFRAYRILNGCAGIPHAYYFGQEGMHNVLIIDLLGPSLEDLFEWCGRKFSIKTTCLVAKQMIQRVKTIHDHDLIYRDIKPDNFLISEYQRLLPGGKVIKSSATSANGDPNLIYMVDFGMAKQYRDPRTKQHIPYRERKSLSGTARYMSINTHFGREQSRRDDLESLGHVFFYFLKGSLPWQGLKAPNNKLKYEKIGLTKQKLDPEELLTDSIPQQFATYLKYVRGLRFNEDPDYNYLISLMDEVLVNCDKDQNYDWMELNNGRGWDITINNRTNLHGYGNPTPRNNHQNNINNINNNNNGSNYNNNTATNININQSSSNIKTISQNNRHQQHQKLTISNNSKQQQGRFSSSLEPSTSSNTRKLVKTSATTYESRSNSNNNKDNVGGEFTRRNTEPFSNDETNVNSSTKLLHKNIDSNVNYNIRSNDGLEGSGKMMQYQSINLYHQQQESLEDDSNSSSNEGILYKLCCGCC